ncbi:hypothetical protein NKH82_15375, partial [Mesorhizobium sp. M0915]|uniref:hypothetical protein n=1 Tax=Mesorhizobium sp. M0915 TaxID=2957027 RepID=UPI003339F77B
FFLHPLILSKMRGQFFVSLGGQFLTSPDTPNLRASDEELTEAILEVASATGLFVCFDGRE